MKDSDAQTDLHLRHEQDFIENLWLRIEPWAAAK